MDERHLSEAAHLLANLLEGTSPCQNREHDGDLSGDIHEGAGFSDLANYWRNLGDKDSLASADISIMTASGDEIQWDKVMSGGDNPPRLDFRAHELSVEEHDISFDVDSFLATATCLSVLRRLRRLFFPSCVRNIRTNLHQRFGGYNLHATPHMHLGSGLLNDQFKILAVFPFMDWKNRVGTFPPQSICASWVDDIFMPSLRKVCPPHFTHHFPLSFAHGRSKALAQSAETSSKVVGRTSTRTYTVAESYLGPLWGEIRRRCQEFDMFRGVFLFVNAKDMKLDTQGANL